MIDVVKGLEADYLALAAYLTTPAPIVLNVAVRPQGKSYKLLGAPAALRRCSGALAQQLDRQPGALGAGKRSTP